MCGRIGKVSKATRDYIRSIGEDEYWRRRQEILRLDAEAGGRAGYNVPPGVPDLSYVHAIEEGELVGKTGRWGLEPVWVKKQGDYPASRGFNVRADKILGTVPGPRPYSYEIKHRRAVVIADFFFEWLHPSKGKDPKKRPWVIRRPEQPMLFASLHAEHPWGRSVGIITTDPNDEIATFHHRMPVVLEPEDVDRWLDPEIQDVDGVADLIRTTPAGWYEIYRVERLPAAPEGGPELLQPLVAE